MKNHILSFLLLSMISFNSFGQKENINDYSNKLLCNAYVYGKTDAATVEFLQAHFPYLARQKPENGYLTPPEGDNAKHSLTTMTFKQHPFFNFKMKSGSIDFFTVDDGGGLVFEKGAQLWLNFDTEGDANYVFAKLVDSLQKLSYQKTLTTQNGQSVILFSGYANDLIFKPSISLIKDPANHIYKILFKREFDEGTGF